VLILVGASGFAYEEASVMMGVAVGTVKSRANRARARLAEMLGLEEGEELLSAWTGRRSRCWAGPACAPHEARRPAGDPRAEMSEAVANDPRTAGPEPSAGPRRTAMAGDPGPTALGAPPVTPRLAAAPARSPLLDRLGFRLAALLAVVLLPLGVISLFQAQAWLTAARDSRAAVLMGQTLQVSAPTTGLLREAQGAAAALARTVQPLLGDEAACDAAMSHLASVSPHYSVVAFVPVNGRMTCAADGAEYDYSDNPVFQELIADLRPTVIVNSRGPVSGTSVLLVIHPVAAEQGGHSGYVALALPHAALDHQAPTGAVLDTESPEFVTLNGEGMVLTSSVGLDRVAEIMPNGMDLQGRMDGVHSSFDAHTAEGEERFYAMVPLIPGQLFALGSVPARDAVNLGPASVLTPFLMAALMWGGSLSWPGARPSGW
jgi:hypothetical protein